MNVSEQQVADVLTSLHLQWEYEPHEYVLERNGDGMCAQGFRPDFYLPEHDMYIEVTAGRQAHTTPKNSKARKLRKQYGKRVELIYRRDLGGDLRARVLELLQGADSLATLPGATLSGPQLPAPVETSHP